MNIPNLLTTFRIILVPIYITLFNIGGKKNLIYSSVVFILAGLTDILDGYIARKYSQETRLGAILDPLADKLMNFAVLYSLTKARLIPTWIIIVIGLKELAMVVGASLLYLFKGNTVVPANIYGKAATASFYIAVFSLILNFNQSLIKLLFSTTVVLNLIAFLNYFIIFINVNKKTKADN